MDVVAALLTALWNRLTGDTQLQSIVGGTVRLYIERAPDNALFPYLVHSLETRPVNPDGLAGLVRADYRLDLWDGANADGTVPTWGRILEMRRRVIELLDGYDLPAPSGEFQNCRLKLDVDVPVPEDVATVRHRHMIFEVRYWRTGEVNYLLAEGR